MNQFPQKLWVRLPEGGAEEKAKAEERKHSQREPWIVNQKYLQVILPK